jgi:hypothetical protein
MLVFDLRLIDYFLCLRRIYFYLWVGGGVYIRFLAS